MTSEQHGFSPIKDEASFQQALQYIAENAAQLANTVLHKELPIDTLTIFTQTDDEYNFIEGLIRQYGQESGFTHGTTLYIETDLTVANQPIKLLGVRRPDPERPQVGYGDYPTAEFAALREAHAEDERVQPIQSGNGIELLELRHPDFAVLGYVVEEEDHA